MAVSALGPFAYDISGGGMSRVVRVTIAAVVENYIVICAVDVEYRHRYGLFAFGLVFV